MGAPEFVPTPAARPVRAYASPPRRPASWRPDRPGDLEGPQPEGRLLGHQGPDQGYALRLAEQLRDRLVLAPGESAADALAGGVAVGLKRASGLGRAPVLADVEVGLGVWGFLDEAPGELVELRRPLFEEAHHPHHYPKALHIAAAVPDEVLRRPAADILTAARDDWRSVIDATDAR